MSSACMLLACANYIYFRLQLLAVLGMYLAHWACHPLHVKDLFAFLLQEVQHD